MKKLLLFAAAGTVAGIGAHAVVNALQKRDPEQPFAVPSALTAAVVGLKPALMQAATPLLFNGLGWLAKNPAFVEAAGPLLGKLGTLLVSMQPASEPENHQE